MHAKLAFGVQGVMGVCVRPRWLEVVFLLDSERCKQNANELRSWLAGCKDTSKGQNGWSLGYSNHQGDQSPVFGALCFPSQLRSAQQLSTRPGMPSITYVSR